MNDFIFNLGDIIKDDISGFKGLVYARSQWLYNCNTYGLKEKDPKDKKPGEVMFFDEPQLSIVKRKAVKPDNGTGGPTPKVVQTNR